MPATLRQLLRSDCLHAPPPLGAPDASPTTRYSLAPNRPSPQHATSSPHCRRSQAPAHSASCRRCTQRTEEAQRRQLCHPQETRCKRGCPIIVDLIVCTQTAPRLAPRKPHHPLQPRAQPPQPTTRSIITALPAFASTREQRQLPPMSRSVPPRFSVVSCVILKRLGPSDAAPAALTRLPARTAAPRLAPRKPHHPL